MQAVLDVHGLEKTFHLHERGQTVHAAAPLDFRVRAGALTALVGPSGAGKSSALKCVYRTYLPTRGRLAYLDAAGGTVDLALADEATVRRLRQRELAFVTQFLHCLPRKSTLEVVGRPLLRLGRTRTEADAAAAEMLDRVGLPRALWALSPTTFSGGERQRVNLARGLVAKSRLVLLDEPTASLDAEARALVVALLREEKRRGAALVAVFHDEALVRELADEVVAVRPHGTPGRAEA